MKKEVADAWVAALRSDEYKQGRQWLRDNGKFCCLGVLCDISKLGSWIGKSYLRETTILPLDVIEYAEMKSSRGLIGEYGDICLTALNDNGKTFTDIADVIEKYWEEL